MHRQFSKCYGDAYIYWDKILNINYKKAKDECKRADDEKLCLKSLLTFQRNWLAYRDSSKKTINDLMGNYDVTYEEESYFEFEATRKQAKVLDMLKRPY
jgi:uncharacterized protein YecT (DUF1311 family)